MQELVLPKTGRKLGPEHEQSRLLAKELSVSVDEAVKRALDESPPTVGRTACLSMQLLT